MDKKELDNVIKKKKYDDKEDLNIKEVAYTKNKLHTILFYTLIIVLIFTLIYTTLKITIKYVDKYKNNSEIIEVMAKKNRVVIVNNGEVKQTISENTFKNRDEIKIEKINSIELITNKNSNEKESILYDIRYNIKKNNFVRNLYSNSDSQVLVKFSYSYDEKEWIYINNVISTTESTISPLIGNYYDIAGLETNLRVITNKELEANNNSRKKIYWRSETIFRKVDDKTINGEFDGNFKIEYKEWN